MQEPIGTDETRALAGWLAEAGNSFHRDKAIHGEGLG